MAKITQQTSSRTPKYRKQKRPNCADQAFVSINGRRHYLGVYSSQESKQGYHRLIAEWIANGGRPPIKPDDNLTVVHLVAGYWRWATSYHKPRHLQKIKHALRPLKRLYGSACVTEFGPLALKAVRQTFVDSGLARSTVNERTNDIRRVFKWGVSNELVPSSVLNALQSVEGLRRGRSDAKETGPVKPVPHGCIDAIRPHVSRQVWALVQLQLLTAARPGELMAMRPVDIDTGGHVWTYKPQDHKTAHHGYDRVLYIGPRGQEVIRPFLAGRAVDACLFSPREAELERLAVRHECRETPLNWGNSPGTNRKKKPVRYPQDHYTAASYRRAIQRGCDKAFPPPDGLAGDELKRWRKEHRWHPHQLRHNAATHIRREEGIEVARVILGHRSACVTELYAEQDHQKAIEVMQRLG